MLIEEQHPFCGFQMLQCTHISSLTQLHILAYIWTHGYIGTSVRRLYHLVSPTSSQNNFMLLVQKSASWIGSGATIALVPHTCLIYPDTNTLKCSPAQLVLYRTQGEPPRLLSPFFPCYSGPRYMPPHTAPKQIPEIDTCIFDIQVHFSFPRRC